MITDWWDYKPVPQKCLRLINEGWAPQAKQHKRHDTKLSLAYKLQAEWKRMKQFSKNHIPSWQENRSIHDCVMSSQSVSENKQIRLTCKLCLQAVRWWPSGSAQMCDSGSWPYHKVLITTEITKQHSGKLAYQLWVRLHLTLSTVIIYYFIPEAKRFDRFSIYRSKFSIVLVGPIKNIQGL